MAFFPTKIIFFYLPPARRSGDYKLHPVRVCVGACVRACVRACVTHFSLKLLQLHIFPQLVVLMNFDAVEYFSGLVDFDLKLSKL